MMYPVDRNPRPVRLYALTLMVAAATAAVALIYSSKHAGQNEILSRGFITGRGANAAAMASSQCRAARSSVPRHASPLLVTRAQRDIDFDAADLPASTRVGRKGFLTASSALAGIQILAASQPMQSRAEFEGDKPFTGTTPVEKLVPGQKQAQRTELYILLKAKIGENVKSPFTSVMQLVLLDAIKRDKESKTGGLDGSIQYELDRLKLSNLKTTVSELKKAQAEVNKEWKSEDKLSFADILTFAGYLKTAQEFSRALNDRSTNGGGTVIATQFSNPFPIPSLGRTDASSASGKTLSSTSVSEIIDGLKAIGMSARDIAALSIGFPGSENLDEVEKELAAADQKVAGFIKSGQQSRKTVTQNAYQVNVGEAYFKLTSLVQQKTAPLAYYYPAPKFDIKKVKL
eukprot:CAMPEP_0184495302 /NCGR_PEP_ID=MMETSP0113_2-20130426/30898_1 /TAXON_ID=91329 /ORGANISM="Norrisiella sphaerica, Strain BC52" /LENGTH=401 /DNA_ID=CAMNT_0026881429 /DNA_START=82 /DNA_END=1287 /DNA_ORIENTATION=+